MRGAQCERERQSYERGRENYLSKDHSKLYTSVLWDTYATTFNTVMEMFIAKYGARRPIGLQFLSNLDTNTVALLCFKTAIGSILMSEKTVSRTSLIHALSKSVITERLFSNWKSDYPGLFHYLLRDCAATHSTGTGWFQRKIAAAFKGLGIPATITPSTLRVHIGATLYQILEKCGLIITRVVTKRTAAGVRQHAYAVLNEDVTNNLLDIVSRLGALAPEVLPMIAPPIPWDSKGQGGYYTKYMRMKFPSIILKARSTSEKIVPPLVTRAVNKLQCVPYKLNKLLYNFIAYRYYNKQEFPGLTYDYTVPKPDYAGKEADQEQWKRDNAKWYRGLRAHQSKQLACTILMNTIEDTADPLYFPHFLDKRGRVYTISHSVHHHGTSIQKNLLHLYDTEALTPQGVHAFFREGGKLLSGNLDTVSKDTLLDEWVTPSDINIPLAYAADDPVAFISWVLEARRIYNECHTFVGVHTGFIVRLDGTCNGYQHIAALFKDEKAARSVNILPTDSKLSLYQQVADSAHAALVRAGYLEEAKLVKSIGKALVKRVVMTVPYGVKALSKLRYVETALAEHVELPDIKHTADIILKHGIDPALLEVTPIAIPALSYLKEMARRVAKKTDKAVEWTIPSGFVAHPPYTKQETKTVKVASLHQQEVKIITRVDTNSVNVAECVLGISPNIIQSLDAAHLHLTVDRVTYPVVCEHDSYGCHPNNIEQLSKDLVHTFYDMYNSGAPLQMLYDIQQNAGVEVVEPPLGNLVLHPDLMSRVHYMFC